MEESKLLIEDKNIVTPGDILAEGLDYLPSSGCYRTGNIIKSKYFGVVRIKNRYLSVIPLAGAYMPKSGDGVIAKISDIQTTFWICDINSPYDAILQIGEVAEEYIDLTRTDISSFFDIGDIIYAKILNVTKSKNILLTMKDYRARKLIGGRLIKVTPSKVPRIIGKEGSMIELIKNKTGCQIIVGQNGIVWFKGQNEALAAKVILMIEKEAHIPGLTDRVNAFLDKFSNIKGEKL
ncbi:MAG: exosome complex RNA-binding protein Rrp4 [Candidatus Aenigmatarchaeota archaeon]|nr:exosome complex protein Rrp4 [Candidatus Aenigmarchaeota archaeon]